MPRSSRSKSHKQSKHSSKEAAAAAVSTPREYCGSDEDVKMKGRSSNGGKEDAVPVRISKDSSVSGERLKHGKDLSTHGNGDVSEEYTASLKRREERIHGGSDRWNGGSSDDKGLPVNIENKESLKSKDYSKVSESKSKSSRKHDSDGALEKDDSKSGSGNRGEKRKSEKESARKESSQYKEHKESKDKDRGSDRAKKAHPDKLVAEASSKQVENQSSKRGKGITEWPIEEELRNPELERELEKRMRRRVEASGDKDRYQDDIKDTDDKRVSSRSDRSREERHKHVEYGDVRETRHKDEKHREDGERDRKNRDVKHRGESERSTKHKDDRYREDKYSEDGNKETKYKDDKYVETGDKDERSRDGKHRQDDDRDYRHKEEKRARDSKHRDAPEAKRSRNDNSGTDLYHRKTSNRDGSPVYEDRVAKYKEDKDRRRGNDKDESSDYRSSHNSAKEQRSELEKRTSAKADSVSERGRIGSHSAKEDRARHYVHSSRDYNSASGQSDKRVSSKDDMVGDLSGEKRKAHSSPQVDKLPSPSSERRSLIKSGARKNLDLEDSGPSMRSGGYKDGSKDGKGSREVANEAPPDNNFSQIDHDNVSVSSPYSRNSHFSGNSKSLLPPPSPSTFRTGSDSTFHGSAEDERSKSNNRYRRNADPNINRSQSQNQGGWKHAPNWPPTMATGGYIPFQHVPQPMFHPLMQQFPPPIFGRPPMKLNPGLPYHVPDHGRPWNQTDESVFGDESHLYGRVDWDRRSRGWDQSGEMWKSQNAGSSMEVQSGQQKDEYSGHRPNEENLSRSTGQPDESEQNQLDIQSATLNLDKNGLEAQKPTGSLEIFEAAEVANSAIITQAYLSRVDVSKGLAEPELYDQCMSMMDLEHEDFTQSVDFDCKILYLEEGVEANATDSTSLFAAIDDSVFQKAMFLYKKQKEEFLLPLDTDADKAKIDSDDDVKPAEDVPAEDMVMEVNKENDEPANKPEETIDMEVDVAVVKQEEVPESSVVAVKDSLAQSASGGLSPESTVVVVKDSLAPSASGGLSPESTVAVVEDSPAPSASGDLSPESIVVVVEDSPAPSASGDLLPCKVEDATGDDNNGGGGGDMLVLSDVLTAEVAVMPTESVEFGLPV